ncbi:peptide chain release factor N(5)-glutamine methyltransferase [Myxosarcina sp. GI1]|uniref:peptide chain release factor N(5)-glutamine methyltransferase n=1 Tax=Myxosarcina sp. GI1 TaxID=1541065 RepID=UPI0009DEBF9E|nr:peptide chain release factor N(5)-glutamine methyltransferase [Myxosarcina sp. GI1]
MQPQNQAHNQHQKLNLPNKSRFEILGKELYLWRDRALKEAIAKDIAVGEVDWLLRETTNIDTLSLRLNSFPDRISASLPLVKLAEYWQQRLELNLPVQYIVGAVYWRQFKLTVTPAVLIPRPETELIIDLALKAAIDANNGDTEHWLDLGTGSGAIALGLATSFPHATVHAVDCSQEALEVARTNARLWNLSERIEFYHGSWWQPLTALKGKVRGMVSNPPYIPTAEINNLQPEVVKHEPHLALDGGEDGLVAIRQLVETAPQYLVSGGIWLVEMMVGQAATVAWMLKQQGSYHKIEILPDLAGIERFALAYRR